jgi:hypothetical protein
MNFKKLLSLLFLIPFFSFSQILSDQEAKKNLLASLDKMYNFQFSESAASINKLKGKYAGHPALHLLEAMQLQLQNPAIEKNPKVKAQYVALLEKCIETASEQLSKKELVAEAKFFLLASHGYLALLKNYEREHAAAANEARKAYGYLKDGFELMNTNPEFYFSTGLYNFYIIQYPITHPIIKPLMIFFSGGDKKLGLQQLETATKQATFTRVEATSYLVNVLLKYENNPARALSYISALTERYPNNALYLIRETETLTLLGKFEEAKTGIANLKKRQDKIYQLSALLFEGLAAEKGLKDDKKATALYQATLAIPNDPRYTLNYHAMAYAGLARVAIRNKDAKSARMYYKKCLDIAEYESLRAEANRYL